MLAITREHLNAIVEFALTGGERVHPTIRLAVAVVDAAGHTLVATREPDAPPLLLDIAQSKAKSCVAIGMPTFIPSGISKPHNWVPPGTVQCRSVRITAG